MARDPFGNDDNSAHAGQVLDRTKNGGLGQWVAAPAAPVVDLSKPAYPAFQTLLNGNNELPSQFQVHGNEDALNQVRQLASAQGPSPWALMQNQSLDNALPGQINTQNSQYGGANTTAQQGLMGAGGLSSSTANSLNKKTGLAQMLGKQNIMQNNITNKQTIASTDAEQKQGAMAALPALENTALQPQQFNIQNQLTQHNEQNQAELERYKQEMSSWATQQTANAQAKSGKK